MSDPLKTRAAFAAWRAMVRQNWWRDDPHLQALMRHHRPQLEVGPFETFGEVCAQQIDPLVVRNNRDHNLPTLQRWDGRGERVEAIEHHPDYAAIGALAYPAGMMSRYTEPGHELESLAMVYLFAQNGEAGHACPMACTAGLIKILQHAGDPRPDWLSRLVEPDGHKNWRGAQFLTEVQGGSDVGANVVRAARAEEGWWEITGEKWFCSVIDADLFLMTARVEEGGTRGLRAFVVPRLLEDGTTNHFHIRRLKDKLGTRSMASAEVDFVGAKGLLVADFKTVMEKVIGTSRLYNAVCSAALIQRAYREAHAYAKTREAFGQPILGFSTTAQIVARLHAEAYAARALTFHLATLADRQARGEAREEERGAYRMLVNLNKLWTSITGTQMVQNAIEVLGGNGAIEAFSVLPRLLRDSIVLEAWEGGHNLLCHQVLRDAQRFGLHRTLFDHLRALGAHPAALAVHEERWARAVAEPALGLVAIRDLAQSLRPLAQAAAIRHSAGGDQLAEVAAEHLLITHTPGWSALEDASLSERVATLVA